MRTKFVLLTLALLGLSSVSFAVPTLQVYATGATAGSQGPDEDTWFVSGSGTFDLVLVGAYGPKTQSITHCTLVASVPQGETGSLSVAGASLLTTKTAVNSSFNPAANADKDILTNVSGNDGYDTKNFLPTSFNNHFPFQSSVSDFVLFDVGSFADLGPVHNYSTEEGISVAGSGQEKTFEVAASGFSSIHFDMYGLIADSKGKKSIVCSWDINPGSHDVTFTPGNDHVVPVPGALLLGSLGSVLVAFLRNRKTA